MEKERARPQTGVTKLETIKKGQVLVDVLDGWAEIWWQGKKLGETPKQIKLPLGFHTLLLLNPETGQRKKVEIEISSGNNQTQRVSF